MRTEEIIKALRNSRPLGPITLDLMLEAAARLESIQWELTQAIATRPEPSRLEIAAMAMQAFISRSGFIMDIPNNALAYADALIKAAKESK